MAMSDLIKSDARFSFHLDGENEIDADILCKLINDISELSKLTAADTDPEAYLKMKIKAFQNGSFQIDFSAICQATESLFFPAIAFANNIVGTLQFFFQIKKFLKGKEQKSIIENDEGIVIENQYGEIISGPSQGKLVFKDSRIDNLVCNITNNIQVHNPSGGFSFDTPNHRDYFNNSDMQYMGMDIQPEEETMCKKIIYRKKPLLIRTAVLDGNSKWTFKLENSSIDATIFDEGFLESIRDGLYRVKHGDYIIADIEALIDINEKGEMQNKKPKYSILTVYGGIRHDYQKEVECPHLNLIEEE